MPLQLNSHVTSNNVLSILNHYWQDKIAHVWQVDDMLESAPERGQTRSQATDAVELLHNVFEDHDSEHGHQLDQSGGRIAGVSP